jgi:hypothetical protein
MLARRGPSSKRIDKNAIPPMRRQEEIVKMRDAGEKVYTHHKEMQRDANYVKGVVDALKWVLREGESPMR